MVLTSLPRVHRCCRRRHCRPVPTADPWGTYVEGGTNSPAEFIRAWQHLVTIFRAKKCNAKFQVRRQSVKSVHLCRVHGVCRLLLKYNRQLHAYTQLCIEAPSTGFCQRMSLINLTSACTWCPRTRIRRICASCPGHAAHVPLITLISHRLPV